MGRMSRTKGKSYELQLVHKLNEYGYQTRRGDCFRREPDIVGLMSVHVECKAAKVVNLSGWMEQSITSAEKYGDGIPVVMFRQVSEKHRCLPWLITMTHLEWEMMGGKDAYATTRNTGIYGRMERTLDAGYKAVIDYLCKGTLKVVTMRLDDWIELYRNWKLPFTEG